MKTAVIGGLVVLARWAWDKHIDGGWVARPLEGLSRVCYWAAIKLG